MIAPDILGHARIRAGLSRALRSGNLHHAYLFEGPVGVGKRTLAVRLAQAANCASEGAELPCGRCATCRQIAAGSHPDVLTLAPPPDRASRTIPVDAVREVVRKTGYHRYGARRRFVIIDPAEAMLPSAANAILKTLEEPPEGTGFVLIASNASALLPTIVSRCQRMRFGAVSEEALVPWLEGRCPQEVALSAARLSQGCPGRALDLAEGGLEKRQELRGALLTALGGSLQSLYKWTESICQGKRQVWMRELIAVLEILEDLLRDVVVQGSGADRPLLNHDVPEVVERWRRALWADGVVACEEALMDARSNLRANVAGKTLLDALLARIRAELG